VGPPLSGPGAGFGQLEVLQVAEIEGRGVLMFSCQTPEMSQTRIVTDGGGGIWVVNIDKPTGPYDIAAAYRLHDESLYAGRLVQDRTGSWHLLGFRNQGPQKEFVGEIADPIAVTWGPDDRLRLEA
jgi:beta-fructofuranosidase